MKRAVLTKFTQDFSSNGVVNQVQVTYSNYEGSQSFNATINLTEADGVTDMTRMNVVQADAFARKKLRDLLVEPGIGELETGTGTEGTVDGSGTEVTPEPPTEGGTITNGFA